MDIQNSIQSQFLAALAMLEQVIVKCPDPIWDAPGDRDKFWNKAYHALFYAHLYLQDTEKHFQPWQKHHDPETGVPFSPEEVLEYLAFVQDQVRERVPQLDMEAESGFHIELPFNKLELQIYNLRHIQQHAGELYERLDRQEIELNWVGKQPDN